MLKPAFNERKAAQVAHLLLRLRGGRMSYLKLIKLMYLIDRAALIKWGRPVTFDHVVSMDNGLVLSETYNLIVGGDQPETHKDWNELISSPTDYEVAALDADTAYDELSDAEELLVRQIFEAKGKKSRWELVEEHHELPEWIDPDGSSIPLNFDEILKKSGQRSYADIETIGNELENIALLEQFIR